VVSLISSGLRIIRAVKVARTTTAGNPSGWSAVRALLAGGSLDRQRPRACIVARYCADAEHAFGIAARVQIAHLGVNRWDTGAGYPARAKR
jgi:hypothetical protein